jgi:hypothetical protein
MLIDLITRLVDEAGAATRVTGVVPFNAPSVDPSVSDDDVLSAQETTNSGLLVAAAPDITAFIVLVVESKTKVAMRNPYDKNQAKFWAVE